MIKKHYKRIILNLTVLFTALSIMPTYLTIIQSPVKVEAAVESTVEPCADVIYWRFRELSDGTIQKRRWNETRGCWMDPYWINVN